MPRGGDLVVTTASRFDRCRGSQAHFDSRWENFVPPQRVPTPGTGMDDSIIKRHSSRSCPTRDRQGHRPRPAHAPASPNSTRVGWRWKPSGGQGSTFPFKVYLGPPKSEASVRECTPRPCAVARAGTLLMVEDEDIVRRPIGSIASSATTSSRAANGNGLALWEQHRDRSDLYTDM